MQNTATQTTKEQYEKLWLSLDLSVDANLQFARHVMDREPYNTKYFFGDYSYEIIKWIAITLFSVRASETDDYIYKIYGDYFEFVTNPIDDFNQPQWYQLKTYKGLNNMKLKSWLMKNAHQYFARKKKADDKRNFVEGEMIEFVDYEVLLGLGDSHESLSDEDCIYRKRLAAAWSRLSEKDKDIIQHLVLDKLNWRDAFDELSEYLNPKGGRQVMETWSDLRKQKALAMMKSRAVEHLTNRFNQVKL